jgi:hypothetical protein
MGLTRWQAGHPAHGGVHHRKNRRGENGKKLTVGEVTVATVRFLSDWSQQQDGEIRAGELLHIEYDPQRLPHCRSSRYGQPAWSIAAYLRFHPGGQEESGRVAPGPQPWEITVPNDAKNIELWFNNTDQSGCASWDSRYGQNYWLEVASVNTPAAQSAT